MYNLHRLGGSVDRDFVLLHEVERPHVVKAQNMVGMSMRKEDGIEPFDSESQSLVAEVGRSVNQDMALPATQQNGWPQPLITFVRGTADLTMAADHGYADTRTGTENQNGRWPVTERHLLGLGTFAAVRRDNS